MTTKLAPRAKQIASNRNAFCASESVPTDEMKSLTNAEGAAVMNLKAPVHRE
jgi:hypothetical protein